MENLGTDHDEKEHLSRQVDALYSLATTWLVIDRTTMGNVQTRERQASRLVGEEHRRKRNLQSSRTVKSNQVN